MDMPKKEKLKQRLLSGPKDFLVTTRISPELYQKAAFISSKQGITLNQFVQKAIQSSIAKIPKILNKKVG